MTGNRAMDEEYVSSEDLAGGYKAADAPTDFKIPTDVLVAIRPFGRKMVTEGVVKPFEAIECYVLEITEDGYTDIGLRDCAWQFVMRELDKSTNETPWVVGTVVKKSRAYFLMPPSADEAKMAGAAIDEMLEERRASEATDLDEEPF